MVLVALLLAAASPYDAAMAKAVSLYNEAEWDASLRELTKAERYAGDDAQRQAALLYQGVVLANIPDLEAAKAAWERALTVDDRARLPLKVSPRVQAQFDEVQKAVQQRKAAAGPTAVEVGVAAPPQRSLPIVSLATLGIGLVAAALGVGFGIGSSADVSSARNAMFQDDKARLHDQAQSFAIVADTSYAVAGVFALWALVSFLVSE
jgi:hypothetical protein